MKIVGLAGPIGFDTTKPDGTPRKLMSGEKIATMGWSPRISLEQGLRKTYAWYVKHEQQS